MGYRELQAARTASRPAARATPCAAMNTFRNSRRSELEAGFSLRPITIVYAAVHAQGQGQGAGAANGVSPSTGRVGCRGADCAMVVRSAVQHGVVLETVRGAQFCSLRSAHQAGGSLPAFLPPRKHVLYTPKVWGLARATRRARCTTFARTLLCSCWARGGAAAQEVV